MPDSNDSPEDANKRKEGIFEKLAAARLPNGPLDFDELEKKGILTREEIEIFAATVRAEMSLEEPSSDPHERLGQILGKVQVYQQSLLKGRAVPLEELARENVLTAADIEFMETHSVAYKPHRLADYHALDMFHMPDADGGCVFMGPGGPPLKKRTHSCDGFQKVMEDFLRLSNPDLLMHIEFTEEEGFALSPRLMMFSFKAPEWRKRIAAVHAVAAEFGLVSNDGREIQESWMMSFETPDDPVEAAAIAFALLTRGCGLDGEIIYSAGALDVLEE